MPIFAFTIIEDGQNVRFNFGNRAFKNPLKEHYETFHSKIIKKLPSFQIKIKDNIEWICNIKYKTEKLQVFDYSQNNLKYFFCFNDSIQKQLNEKIVNIETMINDNYNCEQIAIYLYSFVLNLNDNLICLIYRLFQSIVESLWYKIEKNKINMLNECIFLILFEMKFYIVNQSMGNCFPSNLIRLMTLTSSYYHPFLANYIFIFLKTIDVQNETYKNQTKIHNICIILSSFSKFEYYCCCDYLEKQCKLFFYHVLNYSTNPWCQFYAIKNCHKDQTKLKLYLLSAIEKKEKFPFLIWRNSFNNLNALKNTRVNENSAQLQLYQYVQHYLPETLQTTNDNAFTQDFDFEVSANNEFIFSFFNLMVRNDWYHQYKTIICYKTIRYKFSINPPSFYFEVTIITVGSMRIGLAVKQMDIEDVVGENDLSIGIDGYEKCVWMHKKKYKFKTSRPPWNAGDVIGIYVDLVNRSVIFGINNKIIELDGDPFEEEFIFYTLHCYVAASFSSNQQCFFNFECKVIPRAFLNKLESFNQNIQNVHNSVLMCGSTATTGNIAINGNNIIKFFIIFK